MAPEMADPPTAEPPAPPDLDFHHPHTPYDVQLDFMKTAYGVLEAGGGQVGILESPTGTGKSLSLICAALTWLRRHKRARYEASGAAVARELEGEADWVVEQALRRKREALRRAWEEREARLARVRAKEREAEARAAGRRGKRRRVEEDKEEGLHGDGDEIDEEDAFLVKEWQGEAAAKTEEEALYAGLSVETRAALREAGVRVPRLQEDEHEDGDADEDGWVEENVKIYYTSRTHSQLTQFIAELRRPQFPPSIPGDVADTETVKQLPLSSRQRLCINPSVARLGTVAAINDRCAELQQAKAAAARCAFLPTAEKLAQTHAFRDAVLATVPDIEDLYEQGRQLQVCPYYASRAAVAGAEVVTLPYPLLLQQSAREALGIDLEGSVVIIDEAHNIMDAIAGVHAAEVRLGELRQARQMLAVYVRRFGKKLKGENRMLVAQVAKVIDALAAWMDGAAGAKGGALQADHGIVDPHSLLKARGADQINLFHLIRYIQESKLAYKVESYASHVEQQNAAADARKRPPSSTPVLHTLVSFLVALTNLRSEGRIFYEKLPSDGGNDDDTPDVKLAYLLLSPTHAFASVARSARAVLLAGGTMAPFDDYRTHLFPDLPPAKITTLSCGHVVPAAHLCVATLASTKPLPAGQLAASPDALEFSFQKRSSPGTIRALGAALLNICALVPDGVVVFFPSYGYLDQVVAAWQAPGPTTVWARLGARKTLFRETRGCASEEVLRAYADAILGPGPGALLLSVVGGKMSEGINFADRLGRCVVIVGLPYPNMHAPAWKARIEHVEGATAARLAGSLGPAAAQAVAKQAGRDCYENACMRAVNQSIGRAIRHRADYAAIVLVDRRFAAPRVREKLPGWIRDGMVAGSEEGGMQGLMSALAGFFRRKREGGGG